MIGILGTVNGLAFTGMIINVPSMIIQRSFKDSVSGNTNNILYWLGYLVIGQPLCILLCAYQGKIGQLRDF